MTAPAARVVAPAIDTADCELVHGVSRGRVGSQENAKVWRTRVGAPGVASRTTMSDEDTGRVPAILAPGSMS